MISLIVSCILGMCGPAPLTYEEIIPQITNFEASSPYAAGCVDSSGKVFIFYDCDDNPYYMAETGVSITIIDGMEACELYYPCYPGEEHYWEMVICRDPSTSCSNSTVEVRLDSGIAVDYPESYTDPCEWLESNIGSSCDALFCHECP